MPLQRSQEDPISAFVVAPRRAANARQRRPDQIPILPQFAHYAALCEGRLAKIELSKTTISLVVVCEVQLACVLLHQLLEAVQPGDFIERNMQASVRVFTPRARFTSSASFSRRMDVSVAAIANSPRIYSLSREYIHE